VGLFADVPPDSWSIEWLEAAYSDGLLPACETQPELKICPQDPLDRSMAAFMMYQAKIASAPYPAPTPTPAPTPALSAVP
jgi:hypothetical protein